MATVISIPQRSKLWRKRMMDAALLLAAVVASCMMGTGLAVSKVACGEERPC
jgi:hypothetical protein